LYRSILENKNLTDNDRIAVRDHAHTVFRKTFDFFQIKDPDLYIAISTLGQTLTSGHIAQLWKEITAYQERFLKTKKIRHRNFGVYSKQLCGHEHCSHHGMMTRQGRGLHYTQMKFKSDKSKTALKFKSMLLKKARKNKRQIK